VFNNTLGSQKIQDLQDNSLAYRRRSQVPGETHVQAKKFELTSRPPPNQENRRVLKKKVLKKKVLKKEF
jgi:hypothetical protein